MIRVPKPSLQVWTQQGNSPLRGDELPMLNGASCCASRFPVSLIAMVLMNMVVMNIVLFHGGVVKAEFDPVDASAAEVRTEEVGSRLVMYPEVLHATPRYPARIAIYLVKPSGTSLDVTQSSEMSLGISRVAGSGEEQGDEERIVSANSQDAFDAYGLRLRSCEGGLCLETKDGGTSVDGGLRLKVRFRGLEVTVAIRTQEDKPVSFSREVISTLTKSGCNLGTCHGNLHGKGGMRLSLRGDDPGFDYYRLVAEFGQRRIDVFEPEKSLLLQKGTAQVAHQGGKRLATESAEYGVMIDWIAGGAMEGEASQLSSLEVYPRTQHLSAEQRDARLVVLAKFLDGSIRDVTSWCRFEPSIPSGVTVDASGKVSASHAMDVTVSVTYLSARGASRLVFLGEGLGDTPAIATGIVGLEGSQTWKQPLDEVISQQCRSLQLQEAPRADANTFLRRLFLVTVGRLPTPSETLAYEQDKGLDRDERWVDQLLADPAFDYAWALRWSDLLRNEDKVMSSHGAYLFHDWLRSQIASDRPMKEWIAELVSSTGSTYENPPAAFYRTHRDPEVAAESVAQVFLGVRIQCAKCHNHPFDRWKQDDYYGLAAYFTTVERKQIDNKPNDALDKHVITGDEVISLTDKSPSIRHPGRSKMVSPRGLVFEEGANSSEGEDAQGDVLKRFARWLTEENGTIDSNLANRIWYQYFGRGVVEPPDDFRESNPPSNPELLRVLTEEFRSQGYSLKRFSRVLLLSEAFARGAGEDSADENLLPSNPYFASYSIRRLAAEPLMDAISDVTGVPTKLKTGDEERSEVRSAMRMPGVPKKPGFLTTFGKPNRLLVCECERSNQISLGQSLAMANGVEVRDKLTATSNRLSELEGMESRDAVEELFLSSLCRHPSQREREVAVQMIDTVPNKRLALEDLLWALLNSKEFMTLR